MFNFHFSASATLACGMWVALNVFLPLRALAADIAVDVYDLGGMPLLDAVVYAERIGGNGPGQRRGPARASIDQVNKAFVPLVTVVQTNTEIAFPNSDNIRHSIYSFSTPKPFTTKLYSGRQAPPVLFDKPGLVVLGCNIHDTMIAWIVVVDTPYFAKTEPSGAATLSGLEPGRYHVSAWYPGTQYKPASSDIQVDGSAASHVEFKVDSSESPLPEARARAGTDKVRSGKP